jgi:hypothetical protein
MPDPALTPADGGAVTLPLSGGYLKIPIRIRERFLTEDTDRCVVQACGRFLQLCFDTDRQTVSIRLPLQGVCYSDGREYRLNRNGVRVARYAEDIQMTEANAVDATVVILEE